MPMKSILKFIFLLLLLSCSISKSSLTEQSQIEKKKYYETGEIKSKGYLAKHYFEFYEFLKAGVCTEYYKNGRLLKTVVVRCVMIVRPNILNLKTFIKM
tara:strand:+ start:941 stop:1237 length:297 start_codon:yes stop_codon:yes gene_type:complete